MLVVHQMHSLLVLVCLHSQLQVHPWNLKITFIFTIHWSKFLPSKTGRCAGILLLWVAILHEFSNNNKRTRLCYTNLMEQRIKIEWNQHLKLCSIEEDGIGILGFLSFWEREIWIKDLCNFTEWIELIIYKSNEVYIYIHQVMWQNWNKLLTNLLIHMQVTWVSYFKCKFLNKLLNKDKTNSN